MEGTQKLEGDTADSGASEVGRGGLRDRGYVCMVG